MKKIVLLVLGAIAALIVVANLGHLIGMAISLGILYFAVRGFIKAHSAGRKVLWAIAGFIGLSLSATNIPALVAIAAIYVMYVIFKKWSSEKAKTTASKNDPFMNFEKQWEEMKRS
ncbi:flagellar basal body rod protein [Metabacillus sp. RGM 3146]|uniref:lmo0954 family membrane protein n=1 Tax=Metabacillus sp. RGM 3146 TaxID=3401092 RepID=UPI003B9B9C95